jgi:hypothetical protein
MKVHAIQTGTVALTRAWRKAVGHGRRRLLHAIVDRGWTEPLPIYAFAIEHPEGVIVVDTGEDARASEPGYFARIDQGDHTVFLAGDSSYTQELMLRGKVDGVGADEDAERLTHQRIRSFAAATPTVYLVAHDAETETRLTQRQLVHPLSLGVAA